MGKFLLNRVFCCFLLLATALTISTSVHAQGDYDIGTPVVKDIWVDPVNGKDINDGSTRALAVKTLNIAFAGIPSFTPFFTTGYRVMLVAGSYIDESSQSVDLLSRNGTSGFPLIIQAADGNNTVVLPPVSASDCSYLYLIGLNIQTTTGNDVVNCSGCDHVLLRHCNVNGHDSASIFLSQNTVSFSSSRNIYIEDCQITNAYGANLYFSSTTHAHLTRSIIESSDGSGIVIQNGSADILIERNKMRYFSSNGFSIGSEAVSFLDAMALPWVHYDAYAIRMINNTVSNCDSEVFVCRAGYDILCAYNTFYKIGGLSPALLKLGLGRRTCSDLGQQPTCREYLDSGAWGTVHTYTTDDDVAWIPNNHVSIYNNIFYNPAGYETATSQFTFEGPKQALLHATCPKPANTDNDLRIKGNIIWNGTVSKPLGITPTSGAQPTNPTCNSELLVTENFIHKKEPFLINPENGDLHPATGSPILSTSAVAIPDFLWTDLPGRPQEPMPILTHSLTVDNEGNQRVLPSVPGAFKAIVNDVRQNASFSFTAGNPTPNPTSNHSSINFSVTEHSTVSVSLYDLLGRKIQTIASGNYERGLYYLECETSVLPNGVYLIRFEAGGNTATKQLVVAH